MDIGYESGISGMRCDVKQTGIDGVVACCRVATVVVVGDARC